MTQDRMYEFVLYENTTDELTSAASYVRNRFNDSAELLAMLGLDSTV